MFDNHKNCRKLITTKRIQHSDSPNHPTIPRVEQIKINRSTIRLKTKNHPETTDQSAQQVTQVTRVFNFRERTLKFCKACIPVQLSTTKKLNCRDLCHTTEQRLDALKSKWETWKKKAKKSYLNWKRLCKRKRKEERKFMKTKLIEQISLCRKWVRKTNWYINYKLKLAI